MSFVGRLLLYCPLFRVSFTGDSTVHASAHKQEPIIYYDKGYQLLSVYNNVKIKRKCIVLLVCKTQVY